MLAYLALDAHFITSNTTLLFPRTAYQNLETIGQRGLPFEMIERFYRTKQVQLNLFLLIKIFVPIFPLASRWQRLLSVPCNGFSCVVEVDKTESFQKSLIS